LGKLTGKTSFLWQLELLYRYRWVIAFSKSASNWRIGLCKKLEIINLCLIFLSILSLAKNFVHGCNGFCPSLLLI
jgi:hypothetical protein